MIMVFGDLTTLERIPLSSTCSRFRKLDLELGNRKFDKISVEWVRKGFLICLSLQSSDIWLWVRSSDRSQFGDPKTISGVSFEPIMGFMANLCCIDKIINILWIAQIWQNVFRVSPHINLLLYELLIPNVIFVEIAPRPFHWHITTCDYSEMPRLSTWKSR